MKTSLNVLIAVTVASCLAGCSGDATARDRLRVFAASSLTDVLPEVSPRVTYTFGGSDQLAFQITHGARADVMVSASPRYTDQLHAAGLVEKPRVIARNRLVVIVPRSNPAGIRRLDDLDRPGVKLVLGDGTVPVGTYARSTLSRLGHEGALNNVVSAAPDVRTILATVRLGEADAGVVYVTDARGQRDVSTVAIPPDAQPDIRITIAVVTSTTRRREARAFVDAVLSSKAQTALRRYGFLPAR